MANHQSPNTSRSAAPKWRRIEPSWWRQYREVRLRALAESPDAFGSTYEDSRNQPNEFWTGRLAAARDDTDLPMFATLDGEVVGLAWARIEPPEQDVAHLYQMWVDPRARGRGLGRMLIEAGIAWARTQGATTMVLEVTCGDRPARRLYEAMGFEAVGEPVPMRPGSLLLEQRMALTLE